MKKRPFFLFLIVFSFYLPFGLALSPVSGIDLASVRLLVVGAFIFWFFSRLKKKKLVLPSSLSSFLIFSFLFLSAFSIFFAKNTEWSLRKMLFLLSIFPLYFIARSEIENEKDAEKICQGLVGGGFLVSIIGLGQFIAQFFFGVEGLFSFWGKKVAPLFLGETFSQAVLENPSWLVNIQGKTVFRAIGTFPDPHMFSFYLGMLAPIALGLYFRLKKKKYLFLSLFLIATDMLTFSRGGYLGLSAAVIFFIIFFWKKMGGRYRLGIIFFSFFLFFFFLIPSPFSKRFFSSFDLNEGSNVGRIETWQKALAVIEKNPLLGVGLGNYALEIKPTADYREPIYAHSSYLDIAAETGIPNLFVWLSLLLALLYESLLRAKRSAIFLGFFLSFLVFSVHSLVETAIYSPTILSLFVLILGAWEIKTNNEKNI